MTRKEGDSARKAEARNGLIKDGAGQHAVAATATGADYDAAYAHAVAGRSSEAEAICRRILVHFVLKGAGAVG